MDYNRGIIKQVEELTLENEKLKRDNAVLRQENRELKRRIETLENSIERIVAKAVEAATAPLYARIAALESAGEAKDSEIARLKSQINKDSSNSSKPPSSDGFKKISNSREKSGKKAGGQKGHKGTRLTVPKNLDELVKEGKAQKRVVDFTDGVEKYVSQWEIDLEVNVVYTEYRYPLGRKPMVFYGNQLKALSVLLSNEGMIAQKRLSNFFKSISHGLIAVSEASVEKFNQEAAAPVNLDAIKQELRNSLALNTDETPMRCAQRLEYDEKTAQTAVGSTFGATIRTYSSPAATLYTVNPHKDDAGVGRDGILMSFFGILSHDHDTKYYKYGKGHATCGAHLSRELKGLYELFKIGWADKFRRFIIGINSYKNATDSCEAEQLSKFEREYDALLDEGDAILAEMQAKAFGSDELRPILKRLIKTRTCYLSGTMPLRLPTIWRNAIFAPAKQNRKFPDVSERGTALFAIPE